MKTTRSPASRLNMSLASLGMVTWNLLLSFDVPKIFSISDTLDIKVVKKPLYVFSEKSERDDVDYANHV